MKTALIICALTVAILNGLLLVPSLEDLAMPLGAAATALAITTLVLALAKGKSSQPTAPASVAPPPAPAKNQAETEIVAFFGLLQEKGRFIDFLMEDITPFNDAQVAAASRVVHQGCRAVLNEYFDVTPVSTAPEGSSVTVPTGYQADEYRLVGKISGEPPFTGTLVHKGWKTETVKLPRTVQSDDHRLPAITPAEVELK